MSNVVVKVAMVDFGVNRIERRPITEFTVLHGGARVTLGHITRPAHIKCIFCGCSEFTEGGHMHYYECSNCDETIMAY